MVRWSSINTGMFTVPAILIHEPAHTLDRAHPHVASSAQLSDEMTIAKCLLPQSGRAQRVSLEELLNVIQ